MVLRRRVVLVALLVLAVLVALLAFAVLAVLVALLVLAIFFCSKANLMPANNKADISGVRLTPPTDFGLLLLFGLGDKRLFVGKFCEEDEGVFGFEIYRKSLFSRGVSI
jgi:hypothetical protein